MSQNHTEKRRTRLANLEDSIRMAVDRFSEAHPDQRVSLKPLSQLVQAPLWLNDPAALSQPLTVREIAYVVETRKRGFLNVLGHRRVLFRATYTTSNYRLETQEIDPEFKKYW